jgi:hypothetical protein
MNTSKQVGDDFDDDETTETLVTITFLNGLVHHGIFRVEFDQVPVGKSRMTFRRKEHPEGEIVSFSFRLTRYPGWIASEVEDASMLEIPVKAVWGLILEGADQLGCSILESTDETTIIMNNAKLAKLATIKSGKKRGVK